MQHSITFRAKGVLGTEKVAGVEVRTVDGRKEILSIGCIGTYSGQLTRKVQNCASVLPLDINGTTVDTVTLLFANPFPTAEKVPGIDFIDGEVGCCCILTPIPLLCVLPMRSVAQAHRTTC